MRIEVKFGSAKHDIEVAEDATLGTLKAAIYDATNVLPPLQKLLGKPNLQAKPDDTLLSALGIKEKTKLMLIGSAAAEVVKANAPSAEEKKKEEERERRLRNLPYRFWRLPAYGGFLADPYVGGRGEPLEGGTTLLTLLCMDVILCRLNTLGAGSRPNPSAASTKLLQALGQRGAAEVSHPFLQDISVDLRTAIQRAHGAIRSCYDFTVEASKAVQPATVLGVVDRCVHRITSLPTGEWTMIPSGWIGTHSYTIMFLLVHRRAAEVFDFVVVNRGSEGQGYHPRWQTAEKILSCPILKFQDVSSTRLQDKTFWLLLLSLWMRRNDPQNQSEFIRAEVFYDVLLPWLVEKLPEGRRHEDDVNSNRSGQAGSLHLTTTRFTTEMILQMTGGAADSEQQMSPSPASSTDSPFTPFIHRNAASPICSSSSGIKSVITAFCYILEQYYPALTALEKKRIKYVLKYEFFARAAEDLSRYSRRFLTDSTSLTCADSVQTAPTASRSPAPSTKDAQLRAALGRLKAAGINDTAANLSLGAVWLRLTDNRVYIKDKQNKILPDTDFRDKMVLLFVGSLRVPSGKETSTLLAEAVTVMKQKCGPDAVEVIFLSCDETQDDYEEHCALFDFPRATYPCVEVLNAMELVKVPELLVFQRDGELLHRQGISALQSDPEAAQFPDGPWKGAVPLSATDVQLLRVGASQLAHHTKKRLDRGQPPVADSDAVVQHVVELVHAVEAVVDALPQDDVQELIQAASEVRTSTTASAASVTGGASTASSCPQRTVDAMVQEPIDVAREGVFQNAELLPKVSVAAYYGPAFQSSVPSLPDVHGLTKATNYAELFALLPRVRSVVETLWRRAGNSGTASRVAVQLQIIEFITWIFSTLIPVPLPASYTIDAVPQEERWCVSSFYTEDIIPPALQSPVGEGGVVPHPHAADPQLTMLECVYYLMLSLVNAWQAVETPTRSFDAERCLISMDMLLVFDAILRQVKGSDKCRMISMLLNTGGGCGYFLSTTQGKQNIAFASVAAALQLTRPRLLPIRSAMLRYIEEQQKMRPGHELFDLRMPDKLELFKGSHTVDFLKSVLANAGYSLEQSGGLFGGGSSEMEKLMEWLCSNRSPLAKEHPAFGMMRDMTLLAKFMGTMEMRDAQLLHRRKELDALASWRISFEEDAPGRQMSAGWRTRPAPPRWECLMVRGRDMDIADIAVKGFGDREVMYGEGLALHSPIDVSRMIEVDHPTEDDVLHAKVLPTFAGTMNVEESEVLLSCLTAPYVRIPLVLDFFASQDRHTYLFVYEVQEVLRAVLFEPAAYASPAVLSHADPRSVPMRLSKEQREMVELRRLRGDLSQQNYEDCLGTTYGLLMSELTHAPTSVLRPLRSLLESITELGPSSVYSSNASYVLFVVGLLCDVLSFCRFIAYQQRERQAEAPRTAPAASPKTEESEEAAESRRSEGALGVIEEYHRHFLQFFVATVQPLLWAWLEESEENTDTPTQCVIHAHMSRVDRALWKGYDSLSASAAAASSGAGGGQHGSFRSGATSAAPAEDPHAHLIRMLRSYAFVRARHGFGMGMQRSQLAAQEGDSLLTPEEKMLRFLQAQGLNTSRVSKELLEQGKQLMMSGGRRRAVFVQIRSRNYNDTVRVPNLIHSDPSSTTESKLLKLPPADVPENVLFCDLLEDHHLITSFLDEMTPQRRGAVLLSIVQSVLRDHTESAGDAPASGTLQDRRRLRRSRSTSVSARASAVNLDAMMDDDDEDHAPHERCSQREETPLWSISAPGVYKGPASSGLFFHAQTCELFWRNDELKPVPDSMSHFTDFENILGKDTLQCGLVSRHEHRHWVHLVGTPYDVIEWTAPPDLSDQGVHHPFVIAGNWPAESVESALFESVTYDRVIAVDDDNPWPHKEERWAVNMLRDILRAAFPNGMRFYPLAPALSTVAASDVGNEEEGERLMVPALHHYEMRFLMNDAPQYESDTDRATWKEAVAYRYPQPRIEIYNLVPHARKLYRSLVYSTNQHYCLHSMALLTGTRTRESLAVTAFQAGELKRRIFNESTLEIHRYNEAIRGREVYIPARLLQGLIPSVLLESFFMWQGEDDVLRGYPLSEENETASVLPDAAASGAGKRKPARGEVMDHWFNYSIEVHLHLGRRGSGAIGEAASSPATSSACVVVRRNDKGHSAIVEEKRAASSADAAADAARTKTMAEAQGAAHRLMLERATSGDGSMDLSTDALHANEEDESGGDPIRIADADVALLHEALSHLPKGVCMQLLRQARGDIASALTWASSAANADALLAMVKKDAKASGEEGGSKRHQLAQMVAKTQRAVETCDYVLVNLLHCRNLSYLLQMLTRIEDCSHILAWGRRCSAAGKAKCDAASADEGAAHSLRVEDTTDTGTYVQIELIEMPRLRVRFYTSTDGSSSRARLFLADQPGWRLAEWDDFHTARWRQLRALQAPFQQCLLLCNSTREVAFLCPNHDFAPMKISDDPFNPMLLFDRSSYTWREAVPSPFYVYVVHSSSSFVMPPSLSASLYYAVMQCATQHYAGAMRTLESCYTDSSFSTEEGFMFALFERTMADRFPDACAVRLKLAHAVQYSLNTYQWPLATELSDYLMTKHHVAEDCRLSRGEVLDLLKRCAQATPMVRSQLELYAGLMKLEHKQSGRPATVPVVVQTPALERCRFPWERLLLYPWERIAPQKLKRVCYQLQSPEMVKDEKLVEFLWTDQLLMDEEGGANTKKGFYFLYCMKRNTVVPTIGEEHVGVTLSQLLARWFQLRHSRWGREEQQGSETEMAPSWCSTVLQMMEMFPHTDWPAPADNAERYILARGVSLTEEYEASEHSHGLIIGDQETAVRRRRGTIPELFNAIHRVAQKHFKTDHITEAVREARQMSRLRTPASQKVTVLMRDHLRGRVVPGDTGRDQVELNEADISVDYFQNDNAEGDSAAAALRRSSLQALCTEPLSSLQLAQSVIAEGEPAAPPVSPSVSVLPFDLRTHPLSRTPLAQNMLDRLEEDSMRFRSQQQAQRPRYFQCLSKDIVRELLTTPDVAVMTASLATAVTVLGDCVRQLRALGEQDADRVMRLRSSLLSLANDVHPRSSTEPSHSNNGVSAAGAQSLDRGRLVHYLQRAERSRVAVPLEWLCAGLLSTTLQSDLKAENLFHGSLQQIQAELILLMLLSNRMYFAEQAAQAVQQLLLFLELCGHLRGVVPPHAEMTACGSKSTVQARAARIRELVQHFSLEIDPSVLQQLTTAAPTITNASTGTSDAEATGASDTCVPLSEDTRRTVTSRLQQLANAALDTLTARRTYVHIHPDFSSSAASSSAGGAAGKASNSSFRATLDPRFLVFEFLFNILLRARQVEMVEWFVRNIREGQSRVQQMIMGQGKTTVVGPLLALILADGQQLITQVMPTALLEQTRGILRRCFGVVVTKHIYTVQFDRSNEEGTSDGVELLYQKLKSAEEDRSVVIAAPECVKSLFLKGIEQLHMMESVPTEDMELDEAADDRYASHIKALRRKMMERSALADAITPILELWKRGVLIMDEVDVLLHPLRSELNFPIGLKHPIDMSGPRWLLPIHLLDGIFASQQGRACEDVQRQLECGSSSQTANSARLGGSSLAEMRGVQEEKRRYALSAIRSVILTGFRQRALQREPHLVLLDPGHYYVEQLLPVLVPWLQLWLHEHLMDHLPEQERQNWAYVSSDAFAEKTKPFLLSPVKLDDAESCVSRELNAYMPHYGLQLLNLAHDWLHRLLPHVLAKIDRVSFGVLQPNDLALSGDSARIPYSRKMTAVPFVAKDVPSRSSEFAHPDVVIGLTILAFRYEGLRLQDVKELVTQLKRDFARQAGPKEHRPAAKLYKHWLRLSSSDRAAAAAATEKTVADDNEDVLRSFERAGVPLSQLQVTDKAQMQSLYHLLHGVPEVIHYYLCSTIFPRTMNFQRLKISACGHELGSSMLFTKRIGFSGTPSNILPLDLGECFYEPGSDGRVLSVLTNPEVVHAEVLPDSWTPLRLLDRIAAAQPPYSALIDAGALITNMDNEEVARYLLARLPAALFDGVVFLDRRDRQMILQRDNGLVIPVSQCGVPLARRFTFFDQVHTTGTDVKQSSTAVAVITFGKDLVLRDYAQGAYRMRGIGKGQRLCLYLIPEVVSRIQEALGSRYRTGDMLKDVPAWLLLNSMKVESLQFFKLSLQELANVWRKKAVAHLLHDARHANAHPELFTGWMRCRRFHLPRPAAGTGAAEAGKHASSEEDASAAIADAALKLPSVDVLRAAIAEFREVIEYPVAGKIAQAPSFSEHLQEILQARSQELIEGDALSQGLVEQLLDRMRRSIQGSRAAAEGGSSASAKEASGKGATGAGQEGVHNTMNLNAEIVHEQEAEQEQEQEAEQEEQRISAFSRDDESQIGWAVDTLRTCGTIAADTVRPTHGCCFYQMNTFQIRPSQPKLQVPSQYLVSDNYFRLDWHGVGERRLKNVFLFLEWVPIPAALSASPPQAATGGSSSEAATMVCSGLLTLAEGESMRWLIHHSRYVQRNFRLALRFASSGAYMDATGPFSAVVHRQGVQALRHMQLSSTSSCGGGYDVSTCDAVADRAVLLYRFLNSDMFYSTKQLAVLEEVLEAMSPSDRLHFFTECLRVRRRSRNHWEDAPIAMLFVSEAEKPYLRQLAVGKRMQQGMEDMAEVVVRAARPKASERVRREAEPVQRGFESFTVALSQALSACGASAAFSAERVAEMLTESFPAVFKTLSVQEVAQSLFFLVQQKRGAVGCSAASAPPAAAASADPANYISAEELFAVIPPLNAEVLRERVEAAHAPRPAAAAAQPASIAVWSCDACTFQNPIASNMCSMCMAPKPKSVRVAEDAAMAAAVDAAAGGTGEEDEGDDDGADAPWQCGVCTFINESRAKPMCEICMAPNPRPLKASGGGRAERSPFGGGFECPEGYWVCSVEHGGCSKFNPNALFYCQVCEKARPNLASVRF
ncbi:conserved hypothetical protein [Leishmania infantum JPCM5]|uniref:ubiquitinyl hydrolase 1 n=2 Tax=Leishmania infantum TaxID=5671 RepID=A0A6L0XWY7_LEIIN|nr:conserved hypothetical protein [Leishmania infantum JPCM5]CAC9518839.1 Protein_of_uncharacterised_function_(DUF3638)/Protein_of_uncharacterised_function_(DUF3645)/Zn-finger_in_Ran_binding_protein_and_others_-_putative [Leishmania infantum]CAM70474.1 conserved hypothetical protein [Leishmania infantum JPCM5]SUZ44336.1 Protein_of_uncharacterised_function_(DUF3638)/Protein_of_uncharacterised_function_(DUF3645)/Zn-finger_in_Ran_binding_protein_and_others_-_putative [Leishmania infantum]|eukprot:XP_001467416.1 conserved hypothetical protein [Leishmania infantum JPCM5]